MSSADVMMPAAPSQWTNQDTRYNSSIMGTIREESLGPALTASLGIPQSSLDQVVLSGKTSLLTSNNAPDYVFPPAPQVTRFMFVLMSRINQILFRLFPVVPLRVGDKLLISRRVIYDPTTFDPATPLVPGTTATQSSYLTKTDIIQYIKGAEITFEMLQRPEGVAEFNRRLFQIALAYSATLQNMILDGIMRAPRAFSDGTVVPSNRSTLPGTEYNRSIRSKIQSMVKLFACIAKGPNGASTMFDTVLEQERYRDSQYSFIIGPRGMVNAMNKTQQLESFVMVPAGGVVQSREVAMYNSSTGSLNVVEINPIVVPSFDHLASAFRATCFYWTYYLAAWPRHWDANKRKEYKRSIQLFNLATEEYDTLTEDMLEANVAFDEAKGATGATADYLVLRAQTWDTSNAYAVGPESLAIHLSPLLTLSGISVNQRVLTQMSHFFGGVEVIDPNRVLSLENVLCHGLKRQGNSEFVSEADLKVTNGYMPPDKSLIVIKIPTGTFKGWQGKMDIIAAFGKFSNKFVSGSTTAWHYGDGAGNLKIYTFFSNGKMELSEDNGVVAQNRNGRASRVPQVAFLDAHTCRFTSTKVDFEPYQVKYAGKSPHGDVIGPGLIKGLTQDGVPFVTQATKAVVNSDINVGFPTVLF